jgi:hypothetical protein
MTKKINHPNEWLIFFTEHSNTIRKTGNIK